MQKLEQRLLLHKVQVTYKIVIFFIQGVNDRSNDLGVKHESESEVEASEKGGLADAQAEGPGRTSSQAQIGFKPIDENEVQENHIFNGGGQSSASSSKYSGQSQSQINGKFK